MRKTLLTAVAAAAILSGGMLGHAAAAMTCAAPAALDVAAAHAAFQQVTNVCGTNGCVRVQTQRVRHQKPGSVAAQHI
jgi:energy-converting hydrogenase Eha subunit C